MAAWRSKPTNSRSNRERSSPVAGYATPEVVETDAAPRASAGCWRPYPALTVMKAAGRKTSCPYAPTSTESTTFVEQMDRQLCADAFSRGQNDECGGSSSPPAVFAAMTKAIASYSFPAIAAWHQGSQLKPAVGIGSGVMTESDPAARWRRSRRSGVSAGLRLLAVGSRAGDDGGRLPVRRAASKSLGP